MHQQLQDLVGEDMDSNQKASENSAIATFQEQMRGKGERGKEKASRVKRELDEFCAKEVEIGSFHVLLWV